LLQNWSGLTERVATFAASRVPSVELAELQSVVYRIDPQSVGLPAVSRFELFPSLSVTYPTRSSLASCENEFILSCPASPSKFLRPTSRRVLSELPALLSFVALLACPRRRLRPEAARPVAGLPSSEHLPGLHRISCESTPASATLRPQVFSTSRRLVSASESAGLLHPATTYRVHSVQGFLPIRSLR